MIESYLLFSFFVGVGAIFKSRSFIVWAGLSLLISPLFAGIILLVIGDGDYAICPMCKEKIKSEAKICKHCNTKFI